MCEKAVDVPYWFVAHNMLKNLDYCLFFNGLDPEYDLDKYDNNSDVDSDDGSGYIKSLKLISWFNKYIQPKEYKK